jgi:hypothetical protein
MARNFHTKGAKENLTSIKNLNSWVLKPEKIVPFFANFASLREMPCASGFLFRLVRVKFLSLRLVCFCQVLFIEALLLRDSDH